MGLFRKKAVFDRNKLKKDKHIEEKVVCTSYTAIKTEFPEPVIIPEIRPRKPPIKLSDVRRSLFPPPKSSNEDIKTKRPNSEPPTAQTNPIISPEPLPIQPETITNQNTTIEAINRYIEVTYKDSEPDLYEELETSNFKLMVPPNIPPPTPPQEEEEITPNNTQQHTTCFNDSDTDEDSDEPRIETQHIAEINTIETKTHFEEKKPIETSQKDEIYAETLYKTIEENSKLLLSSLKPASKPEEFLVHKVEYNNEIVEDSSSEEDIEIRHKSKPETSHSGFSKTASQIFFDDSGEESA